MTSSDSEAQKQVKSLLALTERFVQSADRPCLVGLETAPLSYGELWNAAQGLIVRWTAQGLLPGDVIATIVPNHPNLLKGYLAALMGGFVICPILATNQPDVTQAMLNGTKPALVIRDLDELSGTSRDSSAPIESGLQRDPLEPFLIMFTSGSTGAPKAIVHSAAGVLGSAIAFAKLTGMSEQTVLYHNLPMAYMAGLLNAFFAPLLAGAKIVEGPLYSPASAVDFWTRPLATGINTLSITPTIAMALSRMTRGWATIENVSTQIRQVQCTSAAIPLVVRSRFRKVFALDLQDCYGMTELGGPLTFQTAEDARQGHARSCGIDELEFNLRDTDDGSKELWIRSPYSMLGYLKNGHITVPYDRLGFLNTGDLAELDQGRLSITGRRKDLIVRGGINVSPQRVESVVETLPGVQEVVAIGLEHDFWGETIVACVVPLHDCPDDFTLRLQKHCKENLAPHERPDQIVVMETIPRSFIGKVDKIALRGWLSR